MSLSSYAFFTKRGHGNRLDNQAKKLVIRKLSQGIDFVGYVLFSNHTLLRTRTKQRMKKLLKKSYKTYLQGKMEDANFDQRLQSYFKNFISCQSTHLSQSLKNAYWIRKLKNLMGAVQKKSANSPLAN